MPSIGRTGHKEELLLQQPRNVLLWKALEGFSHGWSQGNACPSGRQRGRHGATSFCMEFLRECPSWSSMMFSGIEGYSAIVSPAVLETCCDTSGHNFFMVPMGLHPENSCGSAKLNPKLQIRLVSHIGRWFVSLSLTVIKKFHRKNRSDHLQQSHHSGKKNIQSGTNQSLPSGNLTVRYWKWPWK